NIIKDYLDQKKLNRIIQEDPPQIIHCHLDNDHRLGVRIKTANQILFRSNHYGEGLPDKIKTLIPKTDVILEPSLIAQKQDMEHYNLSPEQCPLIPLSIDLQRFNPNRPLPEVKLELPENSITLGIVARIQTHRKYELLFSALHALIQEGWKLNLIIVGRGTKQEEVAFRPVRELGLEEHVIFTGYLNDDNYVAMLNTFDIGVYLVPGTDGTCRTVREYMAMGIPIIATHTGILPELIQHEKDGIIIEDTVESLYHAIRNLCEYPEYRKELGNNAREKALRNFSPEYQAKIVSEIYEKCLQKMK
ncbi:MAG: glycosyltransferase family 4 protein, partial [Candidatus Hydrogenedens sp.]